MWSRDKRLYHSVFCRGGSDPEWQDRVGRDSLLIGNSSQRGQ